MAAPASFFTFGTVTDTYYGVIGDTADDLDLDPDLPTVSGTATFTPSLVTPLLFTSAPFVATPLPVQGVYDDQGRLALNGSPGVRLVSTDNPLETVTGWTWKVDFAVQVNGVRITRPSFSFKLAGGSVVDLSAVQTVAVINGVPSTVGPKGDPGVGILLRGILTGTGKEVLPSGYGAGQNGYTYRVRSVDGTYDELFAWVWTGSAGSWVDAGPAVGGAIIDDSRTTTFTTWSSAKIAAAIADAASTGQSYTASQLEAYSPDDYIREQNPDGSWPFRNAPTNRHVTWLGLDFPPLGGGYALQGMDNVELTDQLP